MIRKCADDDINDEELEKEMMYFTYVQFKQFISVEDILKYKIIYEILYYCSLRWWELRGLTWKDIDLIIKLYQLKSKSQIGLEQLKIPIFQLLKLKVVKNLTN